MRRRAVIVYWVPAVMRPVANVSPDVNSGGLQICVKLKSVSFVITWENE